MPKISRKEKTEAVVPTASMADIAFLLLIFFMVTTVFVVYRGLPVTRPRAEETERVIEKSKVAHMWIDQKGTISINDLEVSNNQIGEMIYPKLVEIPGLLVSIIADVEAPYGTVADAMRELRRVEALQVMFATLRLR